MCKLNWQASPTMPDTSYFTYTPMHCCIVRDPELIHIDQWYLSCSILGLSNMPLSTKDLNEAKQRAEKVLYENALRMQGNVAKILECLG